MVSARLASLLVFEVAPKRTACLLKFELIAQSRTQESWFDSSGVARCHIRYDNDGLRIGSAQSGVVVQGVSLSPWAPSRTWRFAIGASSGARQSSFMLHHMRTRFGARMLARRTQVRLAQNGQQFTLSSKDFTYFPPPVISSISPPHGPVDGSSAIVLAGAHLSGGSHYLCKFTGDVQVPATFLTHSEQVACRTPPRKAGTAIVEVSLNGQQFTASSLRFTYREPPIVVSIEPSFGPALGGTEVNVYASGLEGGTEYLCRFGYFTTAVPATHEPAMSRLVCAAPQGAGGESVHLTVSTNGQDFSSGSVRWSWRSYVALSASKLIPTSGLAFGGTPVTVFGEGFEYTAPGSCRFGFSDLPSSASYSSLNNSWSGLAFPEMIYLSSELVTCITPSSEIAGVSKRIEVSLTNVSTYALEGSAVIDGDEVALNTAQPNVEGALLLKLLDNGATAAHFVLSFELRIHNSPCGWVSGRRACGGKELNVVFGQKHPSGSLHVVSEGLRVVITTEYPHKIGVYHNAMLLIEVAWPVVESRVVSTASILPSYLLARLYLLTEQHSFRIWHCVDGIRSDSGRSGWVLALARSFTFTASVR